MSPAGGGGTWDLPGDCLEPPGGESFLDACAAEPDALVYLLLNVGDGDTQLLLLPVRPGERTRRAIVVDVATVGKLPALLTALADAGILDLSTDEVFPLVVGTHPHSDHVGGMAQFLRAHGDRVGQFWEPGYYHPSGAYVETMVALEDHPDIRHIQPTSGTTCFVDAVRITVLTPGIGLRGRFDTYGVAINDASISLRVEFPATRVARQPDPDGQSENRIYLRLDAPWALLLGADAQTTAWAQATVDFPEAHRDANPELYRHLRDALGRDALRAEILKVPHHASKRGVNLELVERVAPRLTLISSVAGGGRYNFPHPLTMEAIREALEPTGASGVARTSADHELGIHYTGALVDSDAERPPAGSIAVLVPPKQGARLRVWRLGDGAGDPVSFSSARRLKRTH